MNKQHKWHKEIKAWASGAEIESNCAEEGWQDDINPYWNDNDFEFRIKPQPKEPQYLYVYRTSTNGQIEYRIYHDKDAAGALLGKIKLETEDE